MNLATHINGFAGGGGASMGYTLATGLDVTVALNHDREAIAMHTANHPEARHYCEDIRTVDPVAACRGVSPESAWFSPDCKDFSKAKGGKPKSKRIRGLAWVVIHWVNTVRPKVVFLENVEEFADWGPLLPDGRRSAWRRGWFFQCFVGALRRRGYTVERRELRACDYGAPTIRKRLFLVARCDGQPIAWPAPTHGAPGSEGVKAGALQSWATAAQCIDFALPCPSIFLGKAQARRQRLKRPLAKASCARIARGIDRFVLKAARPFLVSLTHQGGDRGESIDEPARTMTGAHRGEKALVAPVVANVANSKTTGRGPNVWEPEEPLRTVTSSGGMAVISPVLTEFANGSVQRNFAVDEPLRTQCAQVKGGHFGLISPLMANTAHGEVSANGKKRWGKGSHEIGKPFATVTGSNDLAVIAPCLARQFGTSTGSRVDAPVGTVMADGGGKTQLIAAALAKYYGTEQAPEIGEPLHSVTTKDRFGLIEAESVAPPFTPEMEAGARRVAKFLRRHGVAFDGEYAMVGNLVIVDIGMRMLTARELYRAQGFPDSYIIGDDPAQGLRLTKTAQVRMCGNSVCPPVAAALIRANLPALARKEAA